MPARVDHRKEISAVIYLAAAIILGIFYYLPSGRESWLGNVLLNGGRGLIGIAALVLPVLLLYMALDYFLEKSIRITRLRFTYVFLLIIGIAALMQCVTVESDIMRQLSRDDEGQARAFQTLQLLWQSGVDPSAVEIGDKALAGGLLGGSLALAMQMVAGPVASIVLISALILSMIILLFNVSFTRAVGHTAKAINRTRRRVDEAVRSGVAQMKESREEMTTREKADYDIDLEHAAQKEDASAATDNSAKARSSWKDQIKRLWQSDTKSTTAEMDLSVPGFLQEDSGKKDESAPKATPEVKKEQPDNMDGIEQRSPYDLKLKGPDWILSPAAGKDSPNIPVISKSDRENSADLPAGVHRVDATTAAEKAQVQKKDDAAVSGRDNWADRSDDPDNTENSRREKTGRSGRQMTLPWQPPPLDLLQKEHQPATLNDRLAIQALGRKLESTLKSFGIDASVVRHSSGPTITRFELSPGPGVKVSRIVNLADDIALNLAAMGVRIEAPIPGKAAIGIEIPNKETSPVLLRSLLESREYRQAKGHLQVVIGRDIQGDPILCDLTRMPHLLIAGATGSGKSVCVNSILMSILFKSSPEDVKMLMIDPKVVELRIYNGIPHLITEVVTDPKKASGALQWAVSEMTRRYELFADKSVRDINAYNDAAQHGDSEDYEHLPLILLVIDELSDLMATAPTEVEDAIARLTAMARAAGIHLIIATQRPSVDVITGVIKANIPSRIAFAVASQVDSRTILDIGGAEKLLGKGDMLYYPQSAAKPIRGQGSFISDPEVERVLSHIKNQHVPDYDLEVKEAIEAVPKNGEKGKNSSAEDELLPKALGVVVETGYASVSLLQRRMNVGYPRAARLIDSLHDKGFVGPFEGSKPRKVLISNEQFMEYQSRQEKEDN